MRVLVGYASARGSTREVAERMATRLRAAGHVTAVDGVDQASVIASYDALVLGSAIHNGQWLPEAMAAVTRLPSGIENLPVWAFRCRRSARPAAPSRQHWRECCAPARRCRKLSSTYRS